MSYEEIESLLKEAEAENKKSNFDQAEHLINEALTELEKANTLIEKGAMKISTSQGHEVSKRKEVVKLQCEAILVLVNTEFRRGNFDNALEQAQRALALSIDANLNDIIPRAWNTVGVMFYSLGSYEKALESYNAALVSHKEIGNKPGIASVNMNIGNVYNDLGSYDKALEYYNLALVSHQERGDKSRLALVSGNIGVVYNSLGSSDKALEYYNIALASHQELGNKSGMSFVNGNIGNAYLSIGSYDKALEYYNLALTSHQELGNKSNATRVLGIIGNAYYKLESYNKALEYYNLALISHQELGENFGVAFITGEIGSVYANNKFEGYDPIKAEEFLQIAITMCTEFKAKSKLVNKIKDLAGLYENEKRWEDAFKSYQQYHEVGKEVISEEATKQAQLMENRRKVEEAERDRQVKLARFQEQEKILLNILPSKIAERILEGEKLIADMHEEVSIFFSDIVGFTDLSQNISPEELLALLNEIFTAFDKLTHKHGLEKIKTIGDAYMAVAGVPLARKDHAERAASFALDAIEYMKSYQKKSGTNLQIRIGLHCGRAIAGVIGENKFVFDLWGDSVNTASRMESHGEPGKIHVSDVFRNTLKNTTFQFIDRGEMVVKGKGMMKTYFLESN